MFLIKLQARIILTGCMCTVFMELIELIQNEHWDLPHFYHYKKQESKLLFINDAIVPWPFILLNVGSTLYEKVLNDFGDILFTLSVLFFNNLVDQFVSVMKNCKESNTVGVYEFIRYFFIVRAYEPVLSVVCP